MPDLSKIDPRQSAMRRQGGGLPSIDRQAAPIQVNEPIVGANTSGANVLLQQLGMAEQAGDAFLQYQEQKDLVADDTSRANATADASIGRKDDAQFRKSQAYRHAWYLTSAQSTAAEIDAGARQAAQDALDQGDASPEDITKALNSFYQQHIQNPDGSLKDYGTPKATALVAAQMAKTRAEVEAQAVGIIATQQHQKLADQIAFKYYRKYTGEDQNLVDPDSLPPLPGEVKTVDVPPSKAAPEGLGTLPPPTGKLPLQGVITEKFRARNGEHDGIDIDGKIGDPVEAPASGTVVAVGKNQASGNYVRIDHGNGVVTAYAHLSKVNVKKGDTIGAGSTLGLVGNTGHTTSSTGGDGSHLHYVVRVDGKAVDPTSFQFHPGGIQVADNGSVKPIQQPQAPAPHIDFEGAMKEAVVVGVPRALAKQSLLQTFVNIAEARKDPSILDNLVSSMQDDGKTPSFSPKEVAALHDQSQQIADRNRIEADRAQQQAWTTKATEVLQSELDGNPVSEGTLIQLADNGDLDPRFVQGVFSHRQAEADHARVLQNEAEAEARQDRALTIGAEVAARREGIIAPGSYEQDLADLNSGKLGTGTEARANYLMLRSAAAAGGNQKLADPMVQQIYGGMRDKYKPKSNGDPLMAEFNIGTGTNAADWAGMNADFLQRVKKGEDPTTAYLEAVKTYGPKADAATATHRLDLLPKIQRIRALEAKRAAAGQ